MDIYRSGTWRSRRTRCITFKHTHLSSMAWMAAVAWRKDMAPLRLPLAGEMAVSESGIHDKSLLPLRLSSPLTRRMRGVCALPLFVVWSQDSEVCATDVTESATVLPAPEGRAMVCRDCWSVAFGNSFNDEERCVLAGYDNGDVKLFDMRMNKVLTEPAASLLQVLCCTGFRLGMNNALSNSVLVCGRFGGRPTLATECVEFNSTARTSK